MTRCPQPDYNRLFVGVDFRSIGAEPFEMEYIEGEVMREVSRRFGSDWDEMNLRAYPDGDREGLLDRISWLRREKRLLRWRTPRQKGRRPPRDWLRTVRSDAYLWCIGEPASREGRTVFVLVSNDRRFAPLVRELTEALVQTFVIGWNGCSEKLIRAVGADRVCILKPEVVGKYEW